MMGTLALSICALAATLQADPLPSWNAGPAKQSIIAFVEKGVGGWEGGFRVPMLVKWKDKIPASTHTGEFMTMEDWMPILMSWVGDKDVKEDLLDGMEIDGKNYKVHLDGYDEWAENRSWIIGQVGKGMGAFLETFKDHPPARRASPPRSPAWPT